MMIQITMVGGDDDTTVRSPAATIITINFSPKLCVAVNFFRVAGALLMPKLPQGNGKLLV